jgi:hypothetical protein
MNQTRIQLSYSTRDHRNNTCRIINLRYKLLAQILYQDDIVLPAATRADEVLAIA